MTARRVAIAAAITAGVTIAAIAALCTYAAWWVQRPRRQLPWDALG